MKNKVNRALAAKKTRIFTLLLALIACAGTMFANGTKIGNLYYNLNANNKTAEVTYKSYNSMTYIYNEDWSITTATIPSAIEYNSVTYSVTSIGDNAFESCYGLTSVTIGNSVTSIGEGAFRSCTGLTSIYNYATTPQSIESDVFEGVDKSKCKLYVPKGSVNTYNATEGWKDFKNILPIDKRLRDYMNGCVIAARQGAVMVSPFIYPPRG